MCLGEWVHISVLDVGSYLLMITPLNISEIVLWMKTLLMTLSFIKAKDLTL
jgi:hypothetical protein